MSRLLALLLLALPARAATLTEDAEAVVTEVNSLNDAMAFALAGEALARAEREGQAASPAAAWVHQALGAAWLQEGQPARAEASFAAACRISGAPGAFNPRLGAQSRERWAAVCARAAAAGGYGMVLVPAGRFTMGSPKTEPDRSNDETPHTVTITRPFLIGATEVTQGLYEAVMGRTQSSSDTHPVVNVSWCDAVLFANALTAREPGSRAAYHLPAGFVAGMDYGTCNAKAAGVTWDRSADGYRLPTEAEWEYAARAGTTTVYWSGATKADLARVGWYAGNSGSTTHPVGEKKAPNAWGLHDVHGNVWEWVWDGWAAYAGDATDPAVDGGAGRSFRGGCWWYRAARARSANRNWAYPGFRVVSLGFRLVRLPSPSR